MTLRHFGISWVKCDDFFKEVDALTIKTANNGLIIFYMIVLRSLLAKVEVEAYSQFLRYVF